MPWLILFLSIVALATRLWPHPPNFTAMGAVALLAGAYLPRREGIFLPLILLFLTDALIGFYEPLVMLGVYVSFTIVAFLGQWIRKNKTPTTIFIGALSASIIFFAITNLAVWAFTPWYPKTPAGLYQAYALAVPFFRNMLLGDIFFTVLLFSLWEVGLRFFRSRWTFGRASS